MNKKLIMITTVGMIAFYEGNIAYGVTDIKLDLEQLNLNEKKELKLEIVR